jgi:hypothetical protein
MNEKARTENSNLTAISAVPDQSSNSNLAEMENFEEIAVITQDPQAMPTAKVDTCGTDDSGNAVQNCAPAISAPKKIIETASAELEDGTQIEIIEDPKDSSRSLLAVYKHGEVQITDRFESESQIFVPIPRTMNLLRHIRLPRGVECCWNETFLQGEIIGLLDKCVDIHPSDLMLLSHFVLSTWFVEWLPVALYVALVGLVGAGKSIILSALGLLCRRSLFIADVTSAAFYEVCDRFTPTLLIDEAATAPNRRALFHLLRSGTSRDAIVLRKDQSFRVFGAKVISWLELPDDPALNSRCIIIPVQETHRKNLLPLTSPKIRQAAELLQKRLLQFRFEKSKPLILPESVRPDGLRPRSQDQFEALVLPAAEGAPAHCRAMLDFFNVRQGFNQAPLGPVPSAVLKALFISVHQSYLIGPSTVGDLARLANANLEAAGENIRVSFRRVGEIMTSLGFERRRRTNTGYMIDIDERDCARIHNLVAAYGIEFPSQVSADECRKRCSYCKRLLFREETSM